MRFAISAVLVAVSASLASAQSVPQQSLGSIFSPYPGAIYVAPQDSSFSAPGIYRSIERTETLESPIQITQICTRDFRETAALKSLYSGVSEAPGIKDTVHKDFAAKLSGLNLKIISIDAGLEVKNEATYTATPLQVQSADDDVIDVVLSNIGASCKKIILGHLKLGRAVFIAGKAIQAQNFTITFAVGPKADVAVKCLLPIFCPGVSGGVDRQETRERKATKAVTFAIVPADIGGRSILTANDLN